MAKNDNLNDFLKDLADGIRAKKGTTSPINAQNFRSEIESIEIGITPTGSIDITSNGTVDVTNYASANVNVPSGGTPTLQSKVVSPTTENQTVTADSGYDGLSDVTVNAVDSSIDSNITAKNIKSGVNILGVTGTLEVAKGEEEKTVDLSMASGNQVITPTSGKVINKVTITKPSTLLAENIKNGIDIGGVTGTYTGSGGSGSLDWIELDYTNCSFSYESVFLSPAVSQLLNNELTSSGERMIIIRLIGTYLHDDWGDLPVKIMITFSQTIYVPPDIYYIGGGAVMRGVYELPLGNDKIKVDTTFDTTNGTSIKISSLSSELDFSNPNIISLDYVAFDI